jgi:hypothetical protein
MGKDLPVVFPVSSLYDEFILKEAWAILKIIPKSERVVGEF